MEVQITNLEPLLVIKPLLKEEEDCGNHVSLCVHRALH